MIVENTTPLTTITDVRSFEMAAQLQILSEGYLGETTNRRDTIYNGYRGRMEVHFENRDVLDFTRRQVDQARRRTAGVRVNVKVTLAFPGGQRVRVLLKNIAMGEVPMSFGGRAEYGTVSLDFEGEDYAVI